MALIPVDFSFWNDILDEKSIPDIEALNDFLNIDSRYETVKEKLNAESKFHSDAIILYTETAFLQELRTEYRINFLDETFRSIDSNIRLIKRNELLKDYHDFLEGHLHKVKEILAERYPELHKSKINLAKNELPTIKIKWNLGVSVLCSLFYDMLYEAKIVNSGKCLITAEPNDLVSFIATNYVDSDGNSFDVESVEDYIIKKKNGERNKVAKRDRVAILINN